MGLEHFVGPGQVRLAASDGVGAILRASKHFVEVVDGVQPIEIFLQSDAPHSHERPSRIATEGLAHIVFNEPRGEGRDDTMAQKKDDRSSDDNLYCQRKQHCVEDADGELVVIKIHSVQENEERQEEQHREGEDGGHGLEAADSRPRPPALEGADLLHVVKGVEPAFDFLHDGAKAEAVVATDHATQPAFDSVMALELGLDRFWCSEAQALDEKLLLGLSPPGSVGAVEHDAGEEGPMGFLARG
mmetsp:Transcript_13619/g.39671  ORF Transcript_13619/g.39671 Transcript_13619/m.39671 type:complete len:244 (-) Transcript_13619:1215-1946(-)